MSYDELTLLVAKATSVSEVSKAWILLDQHTGSLFSKQQVLPLAFTLARAITLEFLQEMDVQGTEAYSAQNAMVRVRNFILPDSIPSKVSKALREALKELREEQNVSFGSDEKFALGYLYKAVVLALTTNEDV